MHNVIVTGVPRGGTTLAAALIDSLPNTVCLNEPDWQTMRVNNPNHFAKWLAGDFIKLRKKLLQGTPVPDRRAPGGHAVTNYFATDAKTGVMQNTFQKVMFTRTGLSRDFTLAVKHNGPYLGALPAIVDLDWFSVVAIVRHPVPVIHSWRSLELPISRGEMPNAVYYWPEMAMIIEQPMELLEKQVKIYEEICRRLYSLREHIHILPYEAMVKEPKRLSDAIGVQGTLNAGLVGKPSRDVPKEQAEKILAMLAAHGEYSRHFYPKLEDFGHH